MTIKLCLIGIKPYTNKNGDRKFKLIFVSQAEKIYTGFVDQVSPELEQQLVDTDTYQEDRARAQTVVADEWNGKLTYKVIL